MEKDLFQQYDALWYQCCTALLVSFSDHFKFRVFCLVPFLNLDDRAQR